MKKLIFVLFLFLSVNGYSQNAFSTSKYGSTLIECFYILKTSSSIPFSRDCQDNMKQKIFDLSTILKTQLDANKAAITKKIGAENVKEIETQINNYVQYSTTSEETITPEQRKSMLMWVTLSKSTVEGIFIKLKQ